ncbi:hypothetical protein G3I60_11415 [Streptomyces sp. SID13666]|uniref:hypothetical protein n=1 Tax=Streptomyces TaxID=1883 RepID=UPI0011067B94|nr:MULTISPECIES: hypothetical protein [Streptomyces]NEA54739.1 hypothetical protein [Streptomyces sp. SID13666]NEA70528.1 hypothetical protein [Streptomyces sp. SID13588]QNA77326.1 hypothetical protein C8250_040835 [Streptomyces sp. So13.3]
MYTTLTADFWTLFVYMLGAAMVLVLVATLAAEAVVDRLSARRTRRSQIRRIPDAVLARPRQPHHAHY